MNLTPWAKGPLELIRHALEHLNIGGDTDRRIALIGFDNATEVCVDVFIRLPPKLRNNYEIKREDVTKHLRSFNSKIGFVEDYINEMQIETELSTNELLWYHTLRNELYHSGNGMVPEMHVLHGARDNCLAVYSCLFGVDAFELLEVEKEPKEQNMPFVSQNIEMEYLRTFIEFEKNLRQYVVKRKGSARSKRGAMMHVREFGVELGFSEDLLEKLREANQMKNGIVHGDDEILIPDFDYERATDALMEANEIVARNLSKIGEPV